MLSFIMSLLKIVIMLGFIVLIHEGGHFLVAKLFKVRVNEFAIGFGPTISSKEKGETKYALRLIPLGGFVNLEGEEERSDKEGSFSNINISKKIAIVAAGAIVNIIFGILIYSLLVIVKYDFYTAIVATKEFIISILMSLKDLFTTGLSVNNMTGIVGISDIVVNTKGVFEYVYIIAIVSLSLGVTNLLPFPPLDGGKILLYIIEWIRKKPLKEEIEMKIQVWGFSLLIALSIYVTYNDILRIF